MKEKAKVLCVLLFFLSALINGESKDLSWVNLGETLNWVNNEIVIDVIRSYPEDNLGNKFHVEQQCEKYGITFLKVKEEKHPFLMLKSDSYIVLYRKSNSKSFFEGFDGTIMEYDAFETENGFITSSELNEKHDYYPSINLDTSELDKPWSEGSSGNGIGETLRLDGEPWINEIIISIGYVSYAKPWLYKQNTRPKRILVRDLTHGEEFEVELEDTPNPQVIKFEEILERDIELKILEVYPGSKYEDMCINFMFIKG